jgi:PAS domain S-box-containing protein
LCKPNFGVIWEMSTETRIEGHGTPRPFAEDAGGRREAEAALRESEQRLRLLTDALPALISYVDSQECYRLNNTAYERWFGHPREEICGRHVKDVLGGAAYDAIKAHIDTALSGEAVTYEALLPYKDGGHRFVRASYIPHVVESGQVHGFFVLVEDLTERKHAEEALQKARDELELRVEERTRELSRANRELEREIAQRKQTQDLYKTLLHAAPDPIVTVGRDGKIGVVNREVERVFGYDSEELIGQSVEILLPEHLRGSHVHHRSDYFGNAQVRPMGLGLELAARCKDGRDLPVEISLSPVQTTEGAFVIAMIRDITERKQAEESLHRLSGRLISAQEDERRRIARELHDDFNQRLALLAIDLERLHEGLPVSQESLTDDLASLLRRTKEISSDIHSLSHQLHPSSLQHLGLVAATRNFCKEISGQHAIDIEFVHHGVPRSLPDDVALCLYRIVQEALRNVIKHSGAESARIEITGTADGLELQISDNGMGFDPESARTRRGLGLLSIRERLRLVSGTISFERVEPNGTRIEVRVPIPASGQQ